MGIEEWLIVWMHSRKIPSTDRFKPIPNIASTIKSAEKLKELDKKLEVNASFSSNFKSTGKKPYKIKSKGGIFGLFRDIFRS